MKVCVGYAATVINQRVMMVDWDLRLRLAFVWFGGIFLSEVWS